MRAHLQLLEPARARRAVPSELDSRSSRRMDETELAVAAENVEEHCAYERG